MFCALLTSRYQVSVYRTNGPLVIKNAMAIYIKVQDCVTCIIKLNIKPQGYD